MQLLAQINFGAEDMDKPFPKAGLLQFFIGLDEMFGCNFAYAPDQKNYRVVYHPEIDKGVTPEQVSDLGAPGLVDDYRTSPLEEELAIHTERADSSANDRSFVFEEAFRAAHTLKGVTQNLSFTKLYHSSHAITEALRAKDYDLAKERVTQVEADYQQTAAAIQQYQGA